MSSEPKLLTDEDIHALGQLNTHGERVAFLRERGLIAPEPVDPLDARALTLVQKYYPEAKDTYRGRRFQIAREAMELAPAAKPLTREMVARALRDEHWFYSETAAKQLHAAILKQMERQP